MKRYLLFTGMSGLIVGLVSTCCPSIWLKVQEGQAGAPLSLPEPTIAELPILEPTGVDNRFDVPFCDLDPECDPSRRDDFRRAGDLKAASRRPQYPSYVDKIEFDKGNVETIGRAQNALNLMKRKFIGDRNSLAEGLRPLFPASLICQPPGGERAKKQSAARPCSLEVEVPEAMRPLLDIAKLRHVLIRPWDRDENADKLSTVVTVEGPKAAYIDEIRSCLVERQGPPPSSALSTMSCDDEQLEKWLSTSDGKLKLTLTLEKSQPPEWYPDDRSNETAHARSAIYIKTGNRPDAQSWDSCKGASVAKGFDCRNVKVLFNKVQLSRTLLSFVHLGDVQLRHGAVTLTGPDLSRRLDWLIHSFQYGEEQSARMGHVINALFATINKEFARYEADNRERPAFVIHAGDSIDAGVVGELKEFHTLIHKLQIPLYNTLGNHDVLVFGNLMPGVGKDDRACATATSLTAEYVSDFRIMRWLIPNKICVSIKADASSDLEFVAGRSHAKSVANFIRGLDDSEGQIKIDKDVKAGRRDQVDAPAPPRAPVTMQRTSATARGITSFQPAPTSPQGDLLRVQQPYCSSMPELVDANGDAMMTSTLDEAKLPKTWRHGLDMNERRGYYAFAKKIDLDYSRDLERPERNVLFVALNTVEFEEGRAGAMGRVSRDQVVWLRNLLACVKKDHPGDLVFVFGHHPLSEVAGERQYELEPTLASSKNVVAYFYGHKHKHGLCRDVEHGRKTACSYFWEIETAGMLEFPQEARMVRLKYAGNGLAYFDVFTFSERLDDKCMDEFCKTVRRGRDAAELDKCNELAGDGKRNKCSPDNHVYREDGRHTNARLFFLLPELRPTRPWKEPR